MLFGRFAAACRAAARHLPPVLYMDATHCSGEFPGVLYLATMCDLDRHALPIAFAFCPTENNENWKWFIQHVARAVQYDVYTWSIVTDNFHGITSTSRDALAHRERVLRRLAEINAADAAADELEAAEGAAEGQEAAAFATEELEAPDEASLASSSVAPAAPSIGSGTSLGTNTIPVHHWLCKEHRKRNVMALARRKGFSSAAKDAVLYYWNAMTKTYSQHEFAQLRQEVGQLTEFGGRNVSVAHRAAITQWLDKTNPEHWSAAHFGGNLFAQLTSNNAECINNAIKKYRHSNVLAMLEGLLYTRAKFHTNATEVQKRLARDRTLCVSVQRLYKENKYVNVCAVPAVFPCEMICVVSSLLVCMSGCFLGPLTGGLQASWW